MGPSCCVKCKSSDLETDTARGNTVCTSCGSVIEDNLIVSEVQFQEGTRGGSNIIGQTVSVDKGFQGLSMGGLIASGKESRQITLQKARLRIKSVGSALSLNNHCIDMAFNFYKMALSKRLTCGRKNNHVIAACIYITCRLEGTSHMLLDLSDLMQVNVYQLGRVYLKLSGALCINIPVLDPCLYIVRFAYRLNLGEKTHDVEMTALRLVQRMKRDWIHTGRRPSGLCGAALLVATRLNNINKSINEMVDIVKVCETTIRKRLNEFGDTPTSKLTLEEFMTVDLEGEEDPPCYKNANKKIKSLCDSEEKLKEVKEEVSKIQEQIETMLESIRKKFRHPYIKPKDLETESEKVFDSESGSIDEIAGSFIEEDQFQIIKEIIGEDDPTADSFLRQLHTLRPTAASLGIRQSLNFGFSFYNPIDANNNCESNDSQKSTTITEEPEKPLVDKSGDLDLEGIDDAELDMYILSQKEVKLKAKLWLV